MGPIQALKNVVASMFRSEQQLKEIRAGIANLGQLLSEIRDQNRLINEKLARLGEKGSVGATPMPSSEANRRVGASS
jgi:hypothetical protein